MKAAKKMTKKTLQVYQQNWKAVNEFISREAELISPEQRLHQINLLMKLALEPTMLQRRDRYDEELVRARWCRLRTAAM